MSQDNPTHWLISTRHVTAAPFPRLARAVRALAALLDELEEEALAHEGSKGARAIYLKNGLVKYVDL